MSACAGFTPLVNGGDYVGTICCTCGEKESSHKCSIKNPWFRKDGPYSKEFYEVSGDPVFEYRGVKVYRRWEHSWLYVLGDTAITERHGFTKANAPGIIDKILDGLGPSADAVCAHLLACGHKALTHDQYMIECRAGRMA